MSESHPAVRSGNPDSVIYVEEKKYLRWAGYGLSCLLRAPFLAIVLLGLAIACMYIGLFILAIISFIGGFAGFF